MDNRLLHNGGAVKHNIEQEEPWMNQRYTNKILGVPLTIHLLAQNDKFYHAMNCGFSYRVYPDILATFAKDNKQSVVARRFTALL